MIPATVTPAFTSARRVETMRLLDGVTTPAVRTVLRLTAALASLALAHLRQQALDAKANTAARTHALTVRDERGQERASAAVLVAAPAPAHVLRSQVAAGTRGGHSPPMDETDSMAIVT